MQQRHVTHREREAVVERRVRVELARRHIHEDAVWWRVMAVHTYVIIASSRVVAHDGRHGRRELTRRWTRSARVMAVVTAVPMAGARDQRTRAPERYVLSAALE
jgi:hypothetical protein